MGTPYNLKIYFVDDVFFGSKIFGSFSFIRNEKDLLVVGRCAHPLFFERKRKFKID